MKAAIVHSFDQPLALEDVPIPTAGPEQVLVRIEACGLCHTDIHAARGEWPVKPKPPFIPGHEGVGVIERVLTAARRPRGWSSACPTCRPARLTGRAWPRPLETRPTLTNLKATRPQEDSHGSCSRSTNDLCGTR
jgi:hypothetical protein